MNYDSEFHYFYYQKPAYMYQYPHTIQTKHGEKLTFVDLIQEPDGDKLITEGFCKPGAGPVTHVHWKQDESLTVISGKMGTEILGETPKYYGPGETATFFRGVYHRFWNAGEDELHVKGWVKPANNVEFFLTNMYQALNEGSNGRPETKRANFIFMRYKSEFDTIAVPGFVKKVIIPIQYFFAKISGAYKEFKDAPPPMK